MPYYSKNVNNGETSLDLYDVDSSAYPSSGGDQSCTFESGGKSTGYYVGSSLIYTNDWKVWWSGSSKIWDPALSEEDGNYHYCELWSYDSLQNVLKGDWHIKLSFQLERNGQTVTATSTKSITINNWRLGDYSNPVVVLSMSPPDSTTSYVIQLYTRSEDEYDYYIIGVRVYTGGYSPDADTHIYLTRFEYTEY